MTKNKRNKVIALTTAVLLIVALAAMGTIAWLTATDKVDNTFTVGTFNKPDIDPDDPDDPQPDQNIPEDEKPKDESDLKLDGYIYEPSWNINATHKLTPGKEFFKDPYVGIGDLSEAAVVYVYVDNPYPDNVYFELNNEWEAVDQYVAAYSGGTTAYKGGLFKYTGNQTDNGILKPDGGNAWTSSPVFDKVIVADSADADDLIAADKTNTITVSCFIHQAYDADTTTPINADTIKNAAIAALVPTGTGA